MATPFDKFGITEAAQIIAYASAKTTSPGINVTALVGTGKADSSPRPLNLAQSVAALRSMIDGDMWLDSTGWIGPRPGPSEDQYHHTMLLIAQAFVSQNCLADVIDRHVAGVLGREPHWGFKLRRPLAQDEKPTDEEQKLIDEAEAIVTEWWNARKVHAMLQSMTRTMLYARRAPARLFVPRGKMRKENVEGRTISTVLAGSVSEGINLVWPEAPLPETAAVAVDDDTKDSVGVVLTTVGRSVTGTIAGEARAEVTYLADDGERVVIRQSGRGDGQSSQGITLDCGGRIPMYEMSRDAFVTTQMIQLQRAINLTLTSLGRGVVSSGWLERVFANAQMPGDWVDAKDGSGQATGRKMWVPSKNITGAGATTYLKGVEEINDADGSKRFATPTVTFRDPASLAPVIEAFATFYTAVLREAKQEHVLMSQDVKASGKSREQARADFEMTLRKSVAEIDACGRWIIETALAMAEAFAKTPGKFTDSLSAMFSCKVDTGPVTSDERTANDASYQAGTLSREGAMESNNIADVDAEVARINAETGAEVDLRSKIAAAIQSLVSAGADIDAAGRFMGLTEEEASDLIPEFDPATALDEFGNPITPPTPGPKPAEKKPPADTKPTDSGAA